MLPNHPVTVRRLNSISKTMPQIHLMVPDYVPCNFCLFSKSVQDMDLHYNICEVRLQTSKVRPEVRPKDDHGDDPGYKKQEDIHRFISQHLLPRAAMSTLCTQKRATSRASSTNGQRGTDSDGGNDSETLVQEVQPLQPLQIPAHRDPVSPDLADRFPIVEPESPELRPADETEGSDCSLQPSPLNLYEHPL